MRHLFCIIADKIIINISLSIITLFTLRFIYCVFLMRLCKQASMNRKKFEKIPHLQQDSTWSNFNDITSKEIIAVNGVLLNMSLKKGKDLQDIFSAERLDSSEFFYIFSQCLYMKDIIPNFLGLHVSPPPTSTANLELSKQVRSTLSKVKNILHYI